MQNRYKITIEYFGIEYFGMQKQKNLNTIEGKLTSAINYFLGIKEENDFIKIEYSGRTDKDVHAEGQVVHFDTEKNLTQYQIIFGINSYLQDEDISVISAEKVDLDFHARFSAKQRIYKYRIIERKQKLTFQKNLFYHLKYKVEDDLINEAIPYFLGKHDFTAFRSSECNKNPVRTIDYIKMTRSQNGILEFEIAAKSFLHNMVRIIIGTLIQVGLKKIKPQDIEAILKRKDRIKTSFTVPAHGLYLHKVIY